MAKVYPQRSLSSSSWLSGSVSPASSSSSSSYLTTKRESFTIWMKSLVMHSNGCTVYNSSGEIVYRIDNYNEKCRDEVDLMDFRGNVILTIRQKKLRLLGCWEGYRNNEKPWFQVKKLYNVLKRKSPYKITVYGDQADHQPMQFLIEGFITGKSEYRILSESGEPVAEVKQKQSSKGVSLGNDVLTLVVEPHVDHSLVMGIVTVYGIISHKL